MRAERCHPFFECLTVRRCVAQVALKSFHIIRPLESSRKNVAQAFSFQFGNICLANTERDGI